MQMMKITIKLTNCDTNAENDNQTYELWCKWWKWGLTVVCKAGTPFSQRCSRTKPQRREGAKPKGNAYLKKKNLRKSENLLTRIWSAYDDIKVSGMGWRICSKTICNLYLSCASNVHCKIHRSGFWAEIDRPPFMISFYMSFLDFKITKVKLFLREAVHDQNGWIFGKVPNSNATNYIAKFFIMKMIQKGLFRVCY